MTLQIELGQQFDGRWIAEVPTLPGVLTYGMTRTDAVAKVQAWPCAPSPSALSRARLSRSS